MVQIELTPQEAETLADILLSYLSDLRMEIAGTKKITLREELKGREVFIKELMAQLPMVEG